MSEFITRSAATTHYVLASDIELYPSTNLISSFFHMLYNDKIKKESNNIIIEFNANPARQVFVLPIFEVREDFLPPKTKTDLLKLLSKNYAIPFHSYICIQCHLIPKYEEWRNQIPKDETSLSVFHQTKRIGSHQDWEPIFIGTKYEPPYDERYIP